MRHHRLTLLVLAFLAPLTAAEWLPASAEKLPRWRGFNLLEWFNAGTTPTVP